MRHFYSDIPVALYCAIFQPLYLPELPLAEGISASGLEGMQGTVHNSLWQNINSEIGSVELWWELGLKYSAIPEVLCHTHTHVWTQASL